MASKLFLMGFFLLIIAFMIFLFVFYYWFKKEFSRPAYLKRLYKIRYPDSFLSDLRTAYFATESLEYAINLIGEKYTKGNLRKHIWAAKGYLEHSRYKDYETALRFLSDGSDAFGKLYQEILCHEDNKRHRLPYKEDCGT